MAKAMTKAQLQASLDFTERNLREARALLTECRTHKTDPEIAERVREWTDEQRQLLKRLHELAAKMPLLRVPQLHMTLATLATALEERCTAIRTLHGITT